MEEYILVHAGFNFDSEDFFENQEELLNIRDFEYDQEKAGDRCIIHGHNPKSLKEIIAAIKSKNNIIPLDNGCVYDGQRSEMGKLLCFELNSQQLFWEENCD